MELPLPLTNLTSHNIGTGTDLPTCSSSETATDSLMLWSSMSMMQHVSLLTFFVRCRPCEGYKTEMETKPALTKRISESGQVFSPATVAKDIIFYSGRGYFGISTGLDGWLLKQLHPGMSPVNTWAETWQQIFIASFARIIAVFYVLSWDAEVAKTEKKEVK